MIVPTASGDFKGQASGFGSDSGSGSYIDQAYQTPTVRIDDSGRKYVSENTEQQLYYKTDHH